jgi:16S rRNA (cytosine1402-N4)-methyltransferase
MKKNETENRPHISVMASELLKFFEDRSIDVFFDGTLGAGGHAEAILKAHPEIKTFIGCDKDPQALTLARSLLEPWKNKVKLIHGNFADLDQHLSRIGIKAVDGFFLIWGYHPCN